MTHNIIKTKNYLLVVDDSEIKAVDYCTTHLNIIDVGKIHNSYTIFHPTTKEHLNDLKSCKKIIAHLPLNNSPIFEGVDTLPPLEDDVEELASNWIDKNSHKWSNNNDEVGDNYGSFKEGYNTAKEKYKFTEDDLREALFEALNTPKEECCVTHTKDSIVRRVIKSIQQSKTPVEFECEVERIYPNPQTISKEYDFDDILIERKTTTNSQGQTVWVGKYIY